MNTKYDYEILNTQTEWHHFTSEWLFPTLEDTRKLGIIKNCSPLLNILKGTKEWLHCWLQRPHFVSRNIALWVQCDGLYVNDFIKVMIITFYGDSTHSSYLWKDDVTPCFTAYASWKGSKQPVYNGNTIMRSDSWDLPVRGSFEALVKSIHTQILFSVWLSVHVVPICMIQGNRAESQGGLKNPLWFISWTPLYLSLSRSF